MSSSGPGLTSDMTLEVFTQGGDNHKVEAPSDMSGEEFMRGLINGLRLPTTDAEGRPINWRIDNKDTGRPIEQTRTLDENGVRDGHRLSVIRSTVAGVGALR
ncbi:MAG: EsaB/YukD family protein [Bryobacteraceae bacterium]